jgi:hypothetical protein
MRRDDQMLRSGLARRAAPPGIALLIMCLHVLPAWGQEQISGWRRNPMSLRDAAGAVVERRDRDRLPAAPVRIDDRTANGLLRFRDLNGKALYVSEYDVSTDSARRQPGPAAATAERGRGAGQYGGMGLGGGR